MSESDPRFTISIEEIAGCLHRPVTFNAFVAMVMARTVPPEVHESSFHGYILAHGFDGKHLVLIADLAVPFQFVLADGTGALGGSVEGWVRKVLALYNNWQRVGQSHVWLVSASCIVDRERVASEILETLNQTRPDIVWVRLLDVEALAQLAASIDWTLPQGMGGAEDVPLSLSAWRWKESIRWPVPRSVIESRVCAALDSTSAEQCEELDVFADWAAVTGAADAAEIQLAVHGRKRLTHFNKEHIWGRLVGSRIGPVIVRAAAVMGERWPSGSEGLSEFLASPSARLLSPSRVAILNSEVPWADWAGFDFSEMRFGCVFLDSDYFIGACFDGASFHEPGLVSTLSWCDFREATFVNADLRGVLFSDVDARAARFDGADLRGALLHSCKLRGATFRGAKFDAVFLAELERENSQASESMKIDLELIRAEAELVQ